MALQTKYRFSLYDGIQIEGYRDGSAAHIEIDGKAFTLVEGEAEDFIDLLKKLFPAMGSYRFER